MPRRSFRVPGDGAFLDIVSHGRGVAAQGQLLLPAQVEQIARTVRHTPEVMVKISGGGWSAKAVAAHFKYLSRQEFEIETDDGVQLKGKGAQRMLIEGPRDHPGRARKVGVSLVTQRLFRCCDEVAVVTHRLSAADRVGFFTRTWRMFTRRLCQVVVRYLTGPTIAKKMRWMKHIDRRISVAPMMDWSDC